MVLVFIILGIIISTLIIFVILLLSSIKIEIKNLKVGNGEGSLFKSNDKYEIKITLKFLEKIPIFMVNIDNQKIDKLHMSKKLQNINFQKIRNKFKDKLPSNKQILQAIRKIKIKLEKLNLLVCLGTENSIITSYATAFTASIIGIALPHLAGENINNCRYEINPIYQNKNQYYISLDSIFCIKIVHIISNMLILYEKGREKKHERTSNRRSYAYRYE